MIDPDHPDYTNTPVSPRRPPFGYIPADPTSPPAASILTTFFNTGPVFHETAQSVMQQSLQQWEWLIVNDCSTSTESLSILDHYRRLDPRIHVIDHPQNKGPAAARNTGFAAAQTDIIVQLDSDDLLEPTAVEKWVWLLTSYPEYAFANGYSIRFGARQFAHLAGFSSPRAFFVANNVTVTCALRKRVHHTVGGYDESMRNGLEDLDLWLRCASAGLWGATIPEHLDWYRQRENHGDRWHDLSSSERLRNIHYELRQRYAKLWQENRFPPVPITPQPPYAAVPESLPCTNLLEKTKPRLLIIGSAIGRRADRAWESAAAAAFVRQGWETTIVTHDGNQSYLAEITQLTPDAFVLSNFLRLVDYPRFLHYLILSRHPDVVLITGELGCLLLPYLRACHPQIRCAAVCRPTPGSDDRLVRLAAGVCHLLDVIVSTEATSQRLLQHGVDKENIVVCSGDGTSAAAQEEIVSVLRRLTDAPARPGALALSPQLGHIYAIQAVECLRLILPPQRPPTAGQERTTNGEQAGRALRLVPKPLRGALNRIIIWATLPDRRLATPLRVIKRFIPTSLKVALKRRVM